MTDLRNPDFSLRQLQYAVAVARTGSFGRAAELCGVSQPAMSAQLAKLEEALGVQLFERGARGARPTAEGALLIPAAERALTAAADLAGAARSLADPAAVVLRIALIPTVAPYLLPQWVPRLPPAPRVHWLELQTDAAVAALDAGEVDAIVIADPAPRAGLVEVTLGAEPFLVLVADADPRRSPIDPGALIDGSLLLLDEGHCLREQTLALCASPAAAGPYRATSLATVVQLAAMGLGATVLPAMAVAAEAGRAGVRALPLAGPSGRTLRAIWREEAAHQAALRRVADAGVSAFAATQ